MKNNQKTIGGILQFMIVCKQDKKKEVHSLITAKTLWTVCWFRVNSCLLRIASIPYGRILSRNYLEIMRKYFILKVHKQASELPGKEALLC